MKNMEVRSQRSEISDKRQHPAVDSLRSISSIALVAVLACATLVPGRAFVFAQKPQAAPATPQTGTVPSQVDYGRLAVLAAAQVTEFDVNGLKVLVKRRAG